MNGSLSITVDMAPMPMATPAQREAGEMGGGDPDAPPTNRRGRRARPGSWRATCRRPADLHSARSTRAPTVQPEAHDEAWGAAVLSGEQHVEAGPCRASAKTTASAPTARPARTVSGTWDASPRGCAAPGPSSLIAVPPSAAATTPNATAQQQHGPGRVAEREAGPGMARENLPNPVNESEADEDEGPDAGGKEAGHQHQAQDGPTEAGRFHQEERAGDGWPQAGY